MRKLVLLGVVLFGAVAMAQEAPAPEPKPEEKKEEDKGPFSKGRVVFRGGVNFDLNQSINLGGSSGSNPNLTLGVNGGVGYFIIENLELDLDLRFFMNLAPPKIGSFEITPGARYRIWQNILLRAGVPIAIAPQFGVGILGGLQWHQPIGSRAAFVVGVDYTYWFTEYYRTVAPAGRVDIHGGIQTWF